MKKILSLLMLLTIVCSSFSGLLVTVSAEASGVEQVYETSGDYDYIRLDANTAIIKKYRGFATDVVIPCELDGYLITGFGVDAFNSSESVKSITIPDTVTSIEGSGFIYISEIIIDENNKVYDSREECNAIIETATNTLIAGCMNTVILDSVTSLGDNSFNGCSDLTSIIIPSGVAEIGSGAFSMCQNLESISIPDSVTSIGDNVFHRCVSLSEINIDSNNKVYDSRENCNAIIETKSNTLLYGCMNTVIPNDVTNIAVESFSCCEGLTSITIPERVATIGDYAFEGCESLKTVVIEEGVESIGALAFNDCKSLVSVSIPKSVTDISKRAFYKCEKVCLYVYEDSYAHKYAEEENLDYEIITSDGDEQIDVSTMGEVGNGQVDSADSDAKKILLYIAIPITLAVIALCVIGLKKKSK